MHRSRCIKIMRSEAMNAIFRRRTAASLARTRRRHPSVELLETRQMLSTYVVNSTADSGPGTLRRAISDSNGDPAQANVISFDLGTSGVQTIDLLSALPAITQSVTIDGTTEPGFSGAPLVELNGAGAGSTTAGLVAQANDTTVEGLIISLFGGNGIDVSGSNDAILADDIGSVGNPAALGNGGEGLAITGANNFIGTTAAVNDNFIAGNGGDGVLIAGASATGNVVEGVSIGLGPHGNKGVGILVDSQASDNRIGTDGDGVNDAAERNVVSGNASWGIQISGQGTQGNVVAGNYVGTNASGDGAKANGAGGVLISGGASDNLIGTDGSSGHGDERNVISGNNDDGTPGIMISDAGTDSNVVAGNLIGPDATGTTALGNGGVGVFILGGAQSNTIGTNGDGKGDLSERNVIADNAYQGVYIGGTGTDSNIVAGNLIGVDATGSNAMGNGNNGIWIADGSQSNRIGVNPDDPGAAAEPNVISANSYSGIRISDAGTEFNAVSGNSIGTDANNDTNALGNGDDGVSIANGAQSNTIGSLTAYPNVIQHNGGSGVAVYDATTTGNTIRINSISRNTGLGIDLMGDGVTPNHGDTIASGPNNLENYPMITSGGYGTTTTAGFSFVGLPESSYTIDFYANPIADPSGYGQGNRYLGSTTVTTDANGQVNPPISINLPANTNPNQWISATATDQSGDTSEFSAAWQLTALASQVTVTPSPASPIYGQSLSFTATVVPFGSALSTPTGTIQFEVDGSPFGSAVTLVNGAATSLNTSALPAGTHTISTVYSGDSAYSTNTGTLSQTVTPAPLTIIVDDKSKVYGAADPALTYQVTGLVNGDASSVVSGVVLSTTTGAAATAGTHPITVSGGTAVNYNVTDVDGTLTVSKAASLTVTADAEGKVYGAADPSLTYTPSGTLYYGDTYAVISGVSLSTTTGAAATAGIHAITVTGGTAANYGVADVDGTLTVSKATSLTVTADAKGKVYGAADPTLTDTPSGTLYYGDIYSVISGVSLSTATGAAATVGTHAITVTGGTAANYTINDANGTLAVSQAPLSVTADDKGKVYGAADPTLTDTPSGTLYYGDTYAVISGVSLSTATGAAATAGTHPITAAGGTAANYAITDVGGTLNVSQAPLSVMADNKGKVYGAADPSLTYTPSGTLYYGDTYSVISGVSLSTAFGAAATAGTHPITVTGGTSTNYAITDTGGTLTVSQAPLTVTADNKSKDYGAADPTLTYTASGMLYYGDTYSVISGISLSTATGATATAGTHPIIATGGIASNYAITDVNGTLTVAPPPPVSLSNINLVLNKKHMVT